MTPADDQQLNNLGDQVASVCGRTPAVLAAWIFGSRACRRARPSSDLDVAILLDRRLESGFPMLGFASKLEAACGIQVDVVILNRSGELLKHQVRQSGKRVFCRDDTAVRRFEIAGRRAYEDFLYLHRRHVARILHRR